jgi:putative ABC transport system ATP-binding protein
MADSVVSLTAVRREFTQGQTTTVAVDDVTLDIGYGEFIAVLGPSGSGKSTLMNLIGCLDRPTSGIVEVAGYNLAELDDNHLTELRSKAIGFVFQQFQLLPSTSALDNVATPLLYQGVSPRMARARAEEALATLGLIDRLHHDRTQLSGGQQQRVAIARALVTNPAVLLADEPTGALDSGTGEQVLDLFAQLNAKGHTVVLITHDQKVAARAKRQVTMLDGRIASDTTVVSA